MPGIANEKKKKYEKIKPDLFCSTVFVTSVVSGKQLLWDRGERNFGS